MTNSYFDIFFQGHDVNEIVLIGSGIIFSVYYSQWGLGHKLEVVTGLKS